MRLLLILASLVAAVSCGASPTAPPGPRPSVLAAVRIAGLPPSLSPGGTAQLKAEALLGGGQVKDCAAEWSTDAPAVATISPSGIITGALTGYANVTAECDGMRAVAETTVSAPSPYNLILLPRDADVPTEFGVFSEVELLDGDRAGQKFTAGSIFTNGVAGIVWPVKARLTAEMYAPKEVVIAESTGKRRNSSSNLFDFVIPMTFAGAPDTDSHVRQMTRDTMEIGHAFTPRRAGSVRVRTWWSVDYNDRLTVALWCGGTERRSVTQIFGSAGSGFAHELTAAEACEVRLRQHKSDASTRYRVAITYPH